MTTKELLRRLDAFSSLDLAAYFFESELVSYVYRYAYVLKGNKKVTSYTLIPSLSYDSELVYLSVEQFSRVAFSIQVKYFKSFFSRASKTQQDYIRKSLLVEHLLKLL